jgi:nucleoid DNA-binding protein
MIIMDLFTVELGLYLDMDDDACRDVAECFSSAITAVLKTKGEIKFDNFGVFTAEKTGDAIIPKFVVDKAAKQVITDGYNEETWFSTDSDEFATLFKAKLEAKGIEGVELDNLVDNITQAICISISDIDEITDIPLLGVFVWDESNELLIFEPSKELKLGLKNDKELEG